MSYIYLKGPDSMYQIGFDEWPRNTYPQQIWDHYLLTHEAIVPLLAAVQTTPVMPLEDIYITGICAEKANVGIKDPHSKHQYEL